MSTLYRRCRKAGQISIDRLYPTKREADLLAALVPKNNPNSLPVEDFLVQLLAFCQRQDVVNFLFNKDPFQLSFLSNPELSKNACSGMLTHTRVENNTTRHLSYHVRGLFFMAPVFATGTLTFGFGVTEYVYNPATLWDTLNPGIFGRSMSRFVRDDASGIMVIVLDFPELDYIQIDFTQLINTTGQIHSAARFRRRELRAIYESGTFDLQSLRYALDSCHASYQIRNCLVCGANEQCTCSLPTVTPKHPFDMKAFFTNMGQRLGTFQGAAGLTIFQDGKRIHRTSLGTRSAISGGIDPKLIERLQKWAICESGVESDPRHSLIRSTDNVSELLPSPLDVNVRIAPRQDDLSWFDMNEDWYENQSDMQLHAAAEVLGNVSNEPQDTSAPWFHDIGEERSDTAVAIDIAQGTQVELPETTPEGSTSPSSGSRNTSSTPSKNVATDTGVVKKLKAELRKERNRASAQRSNLRKKAEHDAKKLEIKTNKEKATLLRAKEMMLRQENMKLRQQIAGQSATER